ncbi:hypothetical protein Hypma_014815 [Hypsizygus marmoreus]|uniref:Nucleoporin Nup159/Nup146 N-terminal domain-containing protein n=1 Tax=Hypsizygus marmoreus TaxID=39966 RepID=A0A369KEX2_HYPMA|nr:hypothetical protein Hypma_014815 [Hypsizygus marmoreus]
MNDFTPLVRPQQSQVTIDPTAKECPSDGFNWPTYRLLNKQGRVNLSAGPLNPTPTTPYRLFAAANTKGWFAAAATRDGASFSLIFSPLSSLRTAFKTTPAPLPPKRTIPLESQKPNILALACNDTYLLVALEAGQLLVYDTGALFTPGPDTDNITPVHMLAGGGALIRQVVPNPGAEVGLRDLVAVVREDGTVALYNMKLELQGGWAASDQASTPVAVSWSPKGKHIAIGLISGDILTYPLTNKTSISKHIPPTFSAPLVSLTWLGPGHTFRTTYAASPGSDPAQHIITLDVKSSTATYHAPNHPFPLPDRGGVGYQCSYVLPLARWDEDAAGSSEAKTLVIVGDKASVDLEVLGSVGTRWFQQSQENPLSLPLDGNMDDTVLLALDVDLTDAGGDGDKGVPVMYAYLNDGTVQGWFLEGAGPYKGMVTAATATTTTTTAFGQPAPTVPAFEQQATATAFGQPLTFGGGEPAPAFGQPTAISGFGSSGFGTQPVGGGSAFGQGGFGQSGFGGTGAFGQGATPSAFGQASTPSAFGQTSTPSAFGQTSTSSAFGQTSTPSAFGQTTTPSAFGQTSTPSAFGQTTTPSAFGQTTSTPSAFGSGASTGAFGGGGAFGAFASTSGAKNAFGGASFGFGGGAAPAPAPEMSREESMSDSTPGLGGLSLGGMGLGRESTSDDAKAKPGGGMFGSFPAAVAAPTTTTAFGGGAIKPASGFGAFSSYQPATTTGEEKKTGGETTSAFGALAKPVSSGFGQPAFGASGFGQPAFGQSAFGKPAVPATPTTGGFGAFASTAPTSFVSAATQGAAGTSAFGSSAKTTAPAPISAPATGGFGAFASGSPTAFGAAAPKAPATGGAFSAFAASTPSAFGAISTSPALSPAKSAFAPSGAGTGIAVSAFGPPQPGVSAPSPSAKTKEKEKEKPATPAKPIPTASPPSSPESTPRLGKASILQEGNESPPRQPSAFKTAPPSGGGSFANIISAGSGAFGNIQTSPSAFKPASGFGAFGSDTTPSTSPFFKATTQPTTPRALSTPPTSGATPLAAPAFGAATALGSGKKSVFAPAAAAPVTPVKVPATGGFGAFSGSTTAGFGAFAAAGGGGPRKSFGELLKIGDRDRDRDLTEPVKKSTLEVKGKGEGEEVKAPISAFAPIVKTGRVSVFSAPEKKVEKKEEVEEVKEKEEVKKEEEEVKKEEVEEEEEEEEEEVNEEYRKRVRAGKQKEVIAESTEEKAKLTEEPSFGNLSLLSDASSFAEVEHEQPGEDEIQSGSEEDAEGEEQVEFNDEGYELYGEEGDEEGFLSESVTSSEDISEEEKEGEGADEVPLEPAFVPLPASRSPSATPQPEVEVPEIQVTPSPPPPESPEGSMLSTITEESTTTTPPGTPVKEPPSVLFGKPAPAPSTVTPSPPTTTAPFGLGLGRPSTRPTRSSPLASTAISLEDEEEGGKPPKPPVSPQPRVAVLPLPTEGEDEEGRPSVTKRPKTPPLLSAFGPPPAAPAQKPVTIPSSTTTPPTPAPFSLFGKPKSPAPAGATPESKEATAPPATGLFGTTAPKPLTPSAPGIFGTLPTPTPPSGFPAQPMAPSTGFFGAPPAGAKSIFGASPPAPTKPGSIFGAAPPTPAKPATSIFGVPPVPAKPGTSIFGTPPVPSSSTLAPFDLSGLSFNGKGPKGPAMTGLAPSPPPPSSLFGAPAPAAPGLFPVRQQPPPEEGMQKQCAELVMIMTQELAKLQQLVEDLTKSMEVTKSRGGSRRNADLGDSSKWALEDVVQFGQVLRQYEKDLEEMEESRASQKQTIREIQSSMLKAGTRKEEISRFNKANRDKDFAKMLKARTLGPEHLEAQTQLRRNIRAMRDRIQKLEDHLKASKKKLAQANSGTPGLKAPSLDTINRTYRNIDIAVQQQAADVAKLSSRISKLNLSSTALATTTSSSSRDARLPDPSPARRAPANVTPNVAITTAAALNAERSAHRLKRALLAARTEPLLNTKAAAAPPAPVAFNTPQKAVSTFAPPPDFAFKTPLPASLFPVTPNTSTQATPISFPEWTLPEDNFNPSPPPSARRGAGASVKKHGSVPLKKSGNGIGGSQPPAFNWGPLPTFDGVPATSMVQAVPVVPNTWFKAPEAGVAGKTN